MRKIIHVDMDAFFASVEQRDNPELRGKPVAVGHDSERGVLTTASYEARKFGVHSAQSVQIAKKLCPQLIIVPVRYAVYKEISQAVHRIFRDYTDLIEPLSIDEAFLDVTENKQGIGLAVDIARDIKRRIREELQLTASAGVSYNKFLAKIASDYRKPDGLCVIHPDKAMDFIASLPVEDFWGVGPKTAEKMHRMGIFTGLQLRRCSQQHLREVFGKMGQIYYNFARGIDNRPVETDWVRKSVGCERTFEEDLFEPDRLQTALCHTALELEGRLQKSHFEGQTLTLKIKFHDFTQITRSLTTTQELRTKDDILPLARKLLEQVSYSADRPVRLMGLSVSNPRSSEMHRGEWVQLYFDFEF